MELLIIDILFKQHNVAELVIAEIVMLSRGLGDRNNEMHRSLWTKVLFCISFINPFYIDLEKN